MYKKKTRSKLVEDLVDTFEDRNQLHAVYKKKLEQIIKNGILSFSTFVLSLPEDKMERANEYLDSFVEAFVENSIRPQD